MGGGIGDYVNSAARERNWPMGSHAQLIENVRKLISQDPDHVSHMRRLSLSAIQGLHANFYQAFLDEDSVREGIEDAKELIMTLEDLNTNP